MSGMQAQQVIDISGAGTTALIIGEVICAAIEQSYAGDMQKRYGEEGFMLLAHSPFNHEANVYNKTMIATLHLKEET